MANLMHSETIIGESVMLLELNRLKYCTVVQKMANRWPISPHVARPSLEVSTKLLEMNM